jgi:hypothetical protein
MAQQYTKNPTYVLAAQYEGSFNSAYDIAYKQFPTFQGGVKFISNQPFVFFLKTQQGAEVVIESGNFVIQGSNGEFFTLTEDEFNAQYKFAGDMAFEQIKKV